MIEQRPPTHVITIKLPLCLDDANSQDDLAEYSRLMQGTMSAVLSICTLADRGYLCDNPVVEIRDV